MKNKPMSFSLWTLACEAFQKQKAWRNQKVRQARMHPQSKDGSVLRLRSRRALSPAPPPHHEHTMRACHHENKLRKAR